MVTKYKLKSLIYVDRYDETIADIVDEDGEEFGRISYYTADDFYETLVVTVYEDDKERSIETKYDSKLKEDQLEIETNLILEEHMKGK